MLSAADKRRLFGGMYRGAPGARQQRDEDVPEPSEELQRRSIFMRVLDYVNRPYSGIVGGLTELVSGRPSHIASSMADGFMGREQFSAYDLLVAAGANPDSNWTRWGGVALDLFPGGFIDPVSYLTMGATRLGRVARQFGKGEDLVQAARSRMLLDSRSGRGIAGRQLADQGLPTRMQTEGLDLAGHGLSRPQIGADAAGLAPRKGLGAGARVEQTFDLYNPMTGDVTPHTFVGRTKEMGYPHKKVPSRFGMQDVPDYVEAAKWGWWNPVNFAGQPLIPQAAAIPAARARQLLTDKLADSKSYAWVRNIVGGYRAKMKKFPEEAALMTRMERHRGARDADYGSIVEHLQSQHRLNERQLSALTFIQEDPDALSEFMQLVRGERTAIRRLAPKAGMAPEDLRGAMTDLAERAKPFYKTWSDMSKSLDTRMANELRHFREAAQRQVGNVPDAEAHAEALVRASQARRPAKGVDPIISLDSGHGIPLSDTDAIMKSKMRLADGSPLNRDTVEAITEWARWHAWGRHPGLQREAPQTADIAREYANWLTVKRFGSDKRQFEYLADVARKEKQHIRRAVKQHNDSVPRKGPYDVVGEEQRVQMMRRMDEIDDNMLRPAVEFRDKERAARFWEGYLERQFYPELELPQEMRDIFRAGDISADELRRVIDARKALQPVLDDANRLYASRGVHWGRKAGKGYVPHVNKKQYHADIEEFGRSKIGKQWGGEAMIQRLRADYLQHVPDATEQQIQSFIHEFVHRASRSKSIQRGPDGRLMTGRFDAFKHRDFDWPIAVINASMDTLRFHDNTFALANRAYQTASNWAHGYDLYSAMKRSPYARKLKKGEAMPEGYSLMGPRGREPYYVPGGGPNPFEGWIIPDELQTLIDGRMRAIEHLSTDEGIRGFMSVAHKIRRVYSAWTLTPFPSYHFRNLASDLMLGYQAGLNPANPAKWERFMASGDLIRLASRNDPGRFGAFVDNLKRKYPGQVPDDINPERLRGIMRSQGVIDVSPRDLEDFRPVRETQRFKLPEEFSIERWSRVWDEYDHPFLKWGMEQGSKVNDFTRGALFMDKLEESLQHGVRWQQALKNAEETVARHLLDYRDLLPFERQYARLAVPFYTWSAKNIPNQIQTMITDPGRYAYLERAYFGAWNGFDGEFLPEDVPEWMQLNLGLPLRKITKADGDVEYAVAIPTGWAPASDVVQFAHAFRRNRETGKRGATNFLSMLAPWFRQLFEQVYNIDTFTGRAIDEGRISDVYGLPVPPSVAHLLRDVRFVSELDRLNPGGIFTNLGVQRGWWEDQRPDRLEPAERERWQRFLTGTRAYGAEPVRDHERRLRDLRIERNRLGQQMRWAAGQGQTLEVQRQERRMEQLEQEAAARERRIMEVKRERQEGGRGR